MNKNRYKRKERRIKRRNETLKQREALRALRYRTEKKKRETSKKLAVYLFALFNVVVIYAMVAMWYFRDLSYLGVLIADIAAQVLTYAIYCLKAFFAKKAEEDNKLERDKMDLLVPESGQDENDFPAELPLE